MVQTFYLVVWWQIFHLVIAQVLILLMIRIDQRGNVQGVKRLILVRVLVYKMFLRALNLAKIPGLIAMIVTPIGSMTLAIMRYRKSVTK